MPKKSRKPDWRVYAIQNAIDETCTPWLSNSAHTFLKKLREEGYTVTQIKSRI